MIMVNQVTNFRYECDITSYYRCSIHYSLYTYYTYNVGDKMFSVVIAKDVLFTI